MEHKAVIAIYNSKDLIIPVPSGPIGRRWDSILHFLQAVCGNFEPSNYTLKQNVNGQLADLEKQTVSELTNQEAGVLTDDPQTLYIIDGFKSAARPSTCVTLYIALPCSEEYKEFVKQKKPRQWSCPIWTKAELEDCRAKCYPTISKELLEERYRVGGGDARFVLATDPYIGVPSVEQSQV
ncbi:hypothetical protein HDU80_000682 [Chytriomyces hyalinus]|nr:hypothetical protein HDU80_000682 [Chytriomyces hyalinus]